MRSVLILNFQVSWQTPFCQTFTTQYLKSPCFINLEHSDCRMEQKDKVEMELRGNRRQKGRNWIKMSEIERIIYNSLAELKTFEI